MKISNGVKRNKELENLYNMKAKAVNAENNSELNAIDIQIRNELIEKQRKEFEKKLEHLSEIRKEKGNSAAIFKLKEKILGSKKISQEAVSMEDPQTGLIIVEKEKLKEASVKYVSSLLQNREAKEEYKAEFESMENLHEIRAAEIQKDCELTEEDYIKLLKQLSKKNKDKYQFILKAGKSFHCLLFLLYRKVWDSEVKPSRWKQTICHQLFKGKGEKNDFGNQRFIHTKEDIPKAFEQIVITKVKPAIIKHCSKFQTPTCRTPFHNKEYHCLF